MAHLRCLKAARVFLPISLALALLPKGGLALGFVGALLF